MKNLNGTGKQKCALCNYQSIPGLKNGHGKCPFHWDAGLWGLEWSSQCYPNHPEALKSYQHEETGAIVYAKLPPSNRYYLITEV